MLFLQRLTECGSSVIIAAKPPGIKNPVIGPSARRDARKQLVSWRQSFAQQSPTRYQRASRLIGEHLGSLLTELAGVAPQLRVGLYWPFRAEPDWLGQANDWRSAGITILLPVVRTGEPLKFRRFNARTSLGQDALGIATPMRGPYWAPDLLVAPCVGFDLRGYRLGFGGGFYDRTQAQRRVPLIGVAFEAQCIDLQLEAHDQPLDGLITESGVRWWAQPGAAPHGF
jgi:5-formyltetrahydrofolate cyclo-ligase